MNQDAAVRAGVLAKGERVGHSISAGRHVWVHVARGELLLDGMRLGEGDGAAVSDLPAIAFEGGTAGAEVLVFDLA
jgi:hypothetical protein